MSNPKDKITPEKLAVMKQELSQIYTQILIEMEEVEQRRKENESEKLYQEAAETFAAAEAAEQHPNHNS